jgi:hypothetical protein
MSTRSVIGVMHGEKVKTIYCHSDGYIEYNGVILFEHYNSAKANNLVALGDLSSLRKNIEIPEGQEHSFEQPLKDVCIFYGRDRKETGVEFQVCFSDTEMYEKYDWCEFFYVMKDGVWFVSEGPGTEWKFLSDEVARVGGKQIAGPKTERARLPFVAKEIIKQLNQLENDNA